MRISAPPIPLALAILFLAPSSAVLAQDRGEIEFPDRSSIELGAETERALDRTGQVHVEVALPSGAVLSDHNGAMQNVTVARLGPDGDIETLCTDNREAALDFLAGVDRQTTRAARSLPPADPVR
jgi:hypothetical protein